MLNNFKCEVCGRRMGDIDQPICHQCEVAEQDKEANAASLARAYEAWRDTHTIQHAYIDGFRVDVGTGYVEMLYRIIDPSIGSGRLEFQTAYQADALQWLASRYAETQAYSGRTS